MVAMSVEMAKLQVSVPERVRRKVKAQTAEMGLRDSGILVAAVLDYGLALLASGKVPKELSAAVLAAEAAWAARKKEQDENRN